MEPLCESAMSRRLRVLVPLENESEFIAAGRVVEATIAAEPLASSATQLQMLGYILNRQSCPGAKNVRFLTSPGHVCVARIEEDEEKASISLCVSACETSSQGDAYETAVLEIMEVHLQPSTTKLDIGTVPKGRVSSWIAGLEQNSWSVDTEDFMWFLEDSEVRSCSRASHDLASVVSSRLSASDAPLVNKHWPFGGLEGCSYIQRMIEGFPNTCLRPVTKNDLEPPVAWILSYPYGALGPLHVLDEYRRKGLGSWLILSLCEFMRSLAVREGHPCPRIYAFVVKDNVASASMFEKLSNWRRIDETVCWLSCIKE